MIEIQLYSIRSNANFFLPDKCSCHLEITISELHNYVVKNVKDTTKTIYKDLPQVPILYTSTPDRVLYRLP